MLHRRDFLRTAARATAGVAVSDSWFANNLQARQAIPAKHREVFVGDKRVRVVDVHAHCIVPEVSSVVEGTTFASIVGTLPRGPNIMGPDRLRSLDEQGIDVQVLSINVFWWYAAEDRELARQIVKVQNEKLASGVLPIRIAMSR